MIDVLLKRKMSSIAMVGTSAMRMRRNAFATEASTPTSEKTESYCSFLWNSTFRFCQSQQTRLVSIAKCTHLFKTLQTPRIVFSDIVVGEVGRSDVGDGLRIDADDL